MIGLAVRYDAGRRVDWLSVERPPRRGLPISTSATPALITGSKGTT